MRPELKIIVKVGQCSSTPSGIIWLPFALNERTLAGMETLYGKCDVPSSLLGELENRLRLDEMTRLN